MKRLLAILESYEVFICAQKEMFVEDMTSGEVRIGVDRRTKQQRQQKH